MKHTNSGKAFTGREFDDLTTAQQKEACLQARNSFQKYLTFFSSRLILPIISAFPILFLISKKDFSLVSNQATNQRLSNIFKRMVMSLL